MPRKTPPPTGLRMNGTYAGQGGFSIEFHPESAVVGCGEAVVAHNYVVEKTDTQLLVKIQDAARPLVLTLSPDGKLVGSGPIQVAGRVIVGTNPNTREPVYAPRTANCTVGILTATTP